MPSFEHAVRDSSPASPAHADEDTVTHATTPPGWPFSDLGTGLSIATRPAMTHTDASAADENVHVDADVSNALCLDPIGFFRSHTDRDGTDAQDEGTTTTPARDPDTNSSSDLDPGTNHAMVTIISGGTHGQSFAIYRMAARPAHTICVGEAISLTVVQQGIPIRTSRHRVSCVHHPGRTWTAIELRGHGREESALVLAPTERRWIALPWPALVRAWLTRMWRPFACATTDFIGNAPSDASAGHGLSAHSISFAESEPDGGFPK